MPGKRRQSNSCIHLQRFPCGLVCMALLQTLRVRLRWLDLSSCEKAPSGPLQGPVFPSRSLRFRSALRAPKRAIIAEAVALLSPVTHIPLFHAQTGESWRSWQHPT